MKKVFSLFKKDLLLGLQDVYILLEIGFAIVLVLLLIFVIPEQIDSEGVVFIHDETGRLETFIDSMDIEMEEVGEFFVDGRDAVVRGMVENRSAVGVVITAGAATPYVVELLHQPYTPEALVEYVRVEMEDLFSIIHPPGGLYPPDVYESVRITSLQEGLRDEIPFNQMLMPIVLLVMVGILGLFVMVSLLGQERADQTIRALRVAPTNLWQVLISKHLIVLFTGFITFTILYVPMMGLSGYLPALLIMVLTIIMGSTLGTFLGTIVDNPMEGIGWVLVLMIVLSLPAISLLAPVFSPWWMRIIPSYYTVFGLDAAMFPDQNAHVIRQSAAVLGGIVVVLFALSGLAFSRRTRKEA